MKTLTSSSLAKFRTCPKRYWFNYELGRVPARESDALAFGSLWHTCMEHWWSKGMAGVVAYLTEHAGGIDPVDAAKITALLGNYNPPADKFEVVGIEDEFVMPIRNPNTGRAVRHYQLAGKIDLVLHRIVDGKLWICDHKTTAREIIGFGTYWQALQLDSQMGNYCLAKDAAGFVYDAVRKPGVKLCGTDQKQAVALDITPSEAYQLRCEIGIKASPETYYQWREFTRQEHDTREAALDLWQHTKMLHECVRADRWPRNCNSCVGMYGACPYLAVCVGNATIDDEDLYRSTSSPHEELEEVE